MGGKCSVQVTIKELASNKTFVMGDESMNLKVLKHRDLKRRANQLDWGPAQDLIPELPSEMSEMLNSIMTVKNYASKLMKVYLAKKQAIGVGEMLFWHYDMKLSDLPIDIKNLLRKSDYEKRTICLNDLVRWENLANGPNGIAQGPGTVYYRYKKISWQILLKILVLISNFLTSRKAKTGVKPAGDSEADTTGPAADMQPSLPGQLDLAGGHLPCEAGQPPGLQLESLRDENNSDSSDFIEETPKVTAVKRKRAVIHSKVKKIIKKKKEHEVIDEFTSEEDVASDSTVEKSLNLGVTPFITSGQIFLGKTVQLISFTLPLDADTSIPVKVSDGEVWVHARLSSLYRPFFGECLQMKLVCHTVTFLNFDDWNFLRERFYIETRLIKYIHISLIQPKIP